MFFLSTVGTKFQIFTNNKILIPVRKKRIWICLYLDLNKVCAKYKWDWWETEQEGFEIGKLEYLRWPACPVSIAANGVIYNFDTWINFGGPTHIYMYVQSFVPNPKIKKEFAQGPHKLNTFVRWLVKTVNFVSRYSFFWPCSLQMSITLQNMIFQ